MILSAQSILERRPLNPFYARTVDPETGLTYGLSPAGYDIRIYEEIDLMPQQFSLASSMEKFNMPLDVLARVCDKSTWARKGLAVQNTVIEPGWRGHLTIELTNHSSQRIVIPAGSPIAQIIFEKLDEPTISPYDGRYQNQDAGPQDAKFADGFDSRG